jgi:hypothetical protein
MTKSATEVMQEVLYAAVVDAIGAMKAASKGVPNTLLRDLNAIHANTASQDLPAELQASLQASVRAAFTKLLKDGYSVAPTASVMPQRSPAPVRRDGPRPPARPGAAHRPQSDRPGGHRPGGDRPGGGRRPPRGGGPGGPGRGPKPGGGDGPKGGGGR